MKRRDRRPAAAQRGAVALTPAARSTGDVAAAMFATAIGHYQAGRLAEAEAACRTALEAQPHHADALHLRGVIAYRQGRLDAAIEQIARAVALNGRNPAFHHNLGNALQAQGRSAAAAECFARVLALRPDAAEARFNLGNLTKEEGRLDEAAGYYRQAVVCRPDYAEAHNNLALTLLDLGRLVEAAPASARAVALTPGQARYYRNFAETRRFAGRDPHLATMEQLLARRPELPPDERATLHFALGKAYGDLKDFERSFGHLREGNALKRRQIAYDEAAELNLFERIAAVFDAPLMAARAAAGDPSPVPVFILGMPRSGTSLVEQILASHPQAFGAGEREEFGQAVARLQGSGEGASFPEAVAGLPPQALRDLGSVYLATLRRLAPEASRITDKMPRNFLFAGLIHLALPQARIIHTRRDPVDTCLSCFSKLFAGQHPYTYDLGELGRYYRAYERLMAHWRRALPPGVMLEVRYEDVVADLEGQARRLLAHCGLEWDEACLAFHQTPRAVRTASAAQVRQPIYTTSVGRWQAYGAWLRPLLEELGR